MSTVYEVEVLPDPSDMPAEHRARFKTCLERRLARLAANGAAPNQGDSVDVLDNFEGKFVWEMSAAELEANPPSSVEFMIETLEQRADGSVRAVVRLAY